jgi:hypothetical protein
MRSDAQEIIGAPEGIRTPDPQIRSLVLYPAELPAPRSKRMIPKTPVPDLIRGGNQLSEKTMPMQMLAQDYDSIKTYRRAKRYMPIGRFALPFCHGDRSDQPLRRRMPCQLEPR